MIEKNQDSDGIQRLVENLTQLSDELSVKYSSIKSVKGEQAQQLIIQQNMIASDKSNTKK